MAQGSTWSGDLWGGLAAMLVAQPAAIAFGVLVFGAIDPALGPTGAVAGAVGAAVLGLVAPGIGGNGGMVTGPCAPAAAVTAALAGSLAASGRSVEEVLALIATMAALAGLLQVVYGLVGLGRLMKFLPYQVVSGFLSGVGLIIALGQLPRLFGLPAGVGLGGLLTPSAWAWPSLVVGAVTFATILLAPRLTERVPAPVVGLGTGWAAYGGLALGMPELRVLEGNALVIGALGSMSPAGYVAGRVGGLGALGPDALAHVAASAVTLSALLTIDTLKTAVVLDALTRTRHDGRRELVAQGVANIVSALLGGLPGGATMGPTLVNVTSGGRSPRSGLFAGAFALLATLFLLPLLSWLPLGALAGLLLVVAGHMIDWSSLRLLARDNARLDFVVIALVVGVSVTVGLIEASLVGTGLAMLLFIREQSLTPVVVEQRDLSRASSKTRRSEGDRALLDAHGHEGLVVSLSGSLFFGTTDQLFTELADDLARRRFILMDLRRVRSMDYTAGRLLAQMRSQLDERGGCLLFCGMPGPRSPVSRYLGELGLIGEGGIPVFEHQNDAVEWMEDQLLAAHGRPVAPRNAPPMPPSELRLLRDLTPEERDAVVSIMRTVHVGAGEVVFQHDDVGTTLYLVGSGAIDLELPLDGGAGHHLATITRDDAFGEMGFLDGRRRTAEARARRPSVLYALDRDAVDALVERFPHVGKVIYVGLATEVSVRLRRADQELRVLEDR